MHPQLSMNKFNPYGVSGSMSPQTPPTASEDVEEEDGKLVSLLIGSCDTFGSFQGCITNVDRDS